MIKDSLTLYDELIASGVPENQARVQAKQLGGVKDVVDNIEKDLFYLRLIGAAMVASIMANVIWK